MVCAYCFSVGSTEYLLIFLLSDGHLKDLDRSSLEEVPLKMILRRKKKRMKMSKLQMDWILVPMTRSNTLYISLNFNLYNSFLFGDLL